jgi:hypothetical protein
MERLAARFLKGAKVSTLGGARHRVAFRLAVSYMAICTRQRGAQAQAARPNALKPYEGAGAMSCDVATSVSHAHAPRRVPGGPRGS